MNKNSKIGILALLLVGGAILLGGYALFSVASSLGTEFYFLDVGQGDSELIEISDRDQKIQILIDAGPSERIINELSKILAFNDRYIDVLILTHPQLDHFGGFLDVIDKYEVGIFISPGRVGESKSYQFLIDKIVKNNIPVIALGEGDRITIGGVQLQILGPNIDELRSGEVNDASIVFRIDTGKVSALFTGDIGEATEERLVKKYDLKSDLLKISHHGSRFSSSQNFLAEVNPSLAVFEVGKNSYGHPSKIITDRLEKISTRFLKTIESGTMKVIERDGILRAIKL